MEHHRTIRGGARGDMEAIGDLLRSVFPDEDLVPLVDALAGRDDVRIFLAETSGQITGCVVFTICGLENSNNLAGLLGPLAVHPDHARKGVGSALVRTGIVAMEREGLGAVLVLGDPLYYRRFGFLKESRIRAPYPLREDWADAWQSIRFGDCTDGLHTTLAPPDPWRAKALWR